MSSISYRKLGFASIIISACGGGGGSLASFGGSSGNSSAEDEGTGNPQTTNPVADSGSTGSSDGSEGASTTLGAGTTMSESTTVGDSTGGPMAECGNGIIEAAELCDGAALGAEDCISQGFDTGELACAADCSSYDTTTCRSFGCGNGVREDPEICDQNDFGGASCASEGFDNGTLTCSLLCDGYSSDSCGTCGNTIVDGAEVCDNIALLGQTCATLGFDSGAIGCSSDCLTYDTSGCGLCGNAIIDGEEVCDGLETQGATCQTLGFDSGTLMACNDDCLGFDTSGCGQCGNDIIDGDEFCDGSSVGNSTCGDQGFDNGILGCVADCSAYDLSTCGTCGNGVIDGSETCDGAELGGSTCESLGFSGGSIICGADCQYDLSGCMTPASSFGSDSGYAGYQSMPQVLNCDDISLTGTPTGLGYQDYLNVPLGFNFQMYGVPYNNIYISSNGAAYFGTDHLIEPEYICIPALGLSVSANILAVYWGDLDPSFSGEVYYQTLGPVGDRRFVIQWDTPSVFSASNDSLRIQAMIHEGGSIEYCYPDTLDGSGVTENGAFMTVGIQQDETTGLEYSCQTATVTSGLQLLFVPL